MRQTKRKNISAMKTKRTINTREATKNSHFYCNLLQQWYPKLKDTHMQTVQESIKRHQYQFLKSCHLSRVMIEDQAISEFESLKRDFFEEVYSSYTLIWEFACDIYRLRSILSPPNSSLGQLQHLFEGFSRMPDP